MDYLQNLKCCYRKPKNVKSNALGIIANTRSSIVILTFSNRDLRQAFEIFTSRGDIDNANNNNAILIQILKLRLEKLSYLVLNLVTDWSLSNTMAKTPETHNEFNDV